MILSVEADGVVPAGNYVSLDDDRNEGMPADMENSLADADASSMPPGNAAGLSSSEARERLQRFGANATPDTAANPWQVALGKFWAPVPWMLEARSCSACARRVCRGRGHRRPAGVQCRRSDLSRKAARRRRLAALQSRLALTASVRRDGSWATCRPPSWCRATS